MSRMDTRVITLVATMLIASVCGAVCLFVFLLSNAWGGRTVDLSIPSFGGQPTEVVSSSGGGVDTSTGGSNQSSGGSVNAPNSGGASAPVTSGGNTGSSAPVTTGDASALLPTLSGYTATEASTINGAINLIMQGSGFSAQSADETTFSAQSLSAIATSVLVARIDDFIACYRRTGAVDARVYVGTDVASILAGEVPPLGAVAVVNQDRLRDSLTTCAISPNDGFSAQAADVCSDLGNFTLNGESITYVYAGSAQDFCNAVDRHFAQYGG